MISVNCPNCNSLLRVKPEHIGTRKTCPACKQKILVPNGAIADDVEMVSVSPLKTNSMPDPIPPTKEDPEDSDEARVPTVRCPFCRARMEPGIAYGSPTLEGWLFMVFSYFAWLFATGTINGAGADFAEITRRSPRSDEFFIIANLILGVLFLLPPLWLLKRKTHHVCSECHIRLD